MRILIGLTAALHRSTVRQRVHAGTPGARLVHILLAAGVLLPAADAGAAPTLFWASDPIRPGETALVVGDGFGEKPRVEIARLPDGPSFTPIAQGFRWPGKGQPVEVIQPCDTSLKFVVPAGLRFGVFAFRISTPGGSAVGMLNRPKAWWAQGDLGGAASPGGHLRVFGQNLSFSEEMASPRRLAAPPRPSPPDGDPLLFLQGAKQRTLFVNEVSTGYSVGASMTDYGPPVRPGFSNPPFFTAGEYQVRVHNGFGGNAGWSEPIHITVRKPKPWPAARFDVREFGAEGSGATDDTAAIQAALDKGGAAGGGVVYLPRGRYRVTATLTLPRFVALRGEKRELVSLFWPDMPSPPEALIRGTNSFAVEELTLYASNHRHVIVGDLGSVPGSGNVRLHRLRVRANAYRGHLKPEEVDSILRESLKSSTGGGDTVRLGGDNIWITDCDLYGSGRVLFLSRTRGGLVRGNTLYNGRWGWYCISGSNGLIFEGNEVVGADLMSTGGGLNCLDGSTSSENVYYAGNRLRLMHGWDREAMTSDAGGDAYIGKVKAVDGKVMTLAEEGKWSRRSWQGAAVFLLDGKGAGQYRRVVRGEGAIVEVDRPWQVPPDATTDVGITMFQGHYLVLDNDFTDTGAMQFYGTAVECVVAGNQGTRMQGFHGLGLWYHGYQPDWYCQFLGNRILEGNYYHWTSASDALLGVTGAQRAPYLGPMNRAAVLRDNRLGSNSCIRVSGACRDVLVENNTVQNAAMGVYISRQCANVLRRGNQFRNVAQEVVDEESLRRAAEERMKQFIGRKEPVAAWSFDAMAGGRYPDASGNGFHLDADGGVAAVDGGVRGKAVRFDGTGFLRGSEAMAFNTPDVTASLWVKPETLRGRRGLIAKRFAGTASPFVVSQTYGALGFEATEQNGPWTFNFAGPSVLKEGEWTHVAAVVKRGEGVTLYANGKPVAEKKNAANREINNEPLVLGREAWGGDPPAGGTPGFFLGLLDEVKVWARALSPAEVRAEWEAGAQR